jgi:acetyl-CoA acetyltransferase
MGNEDFEECFGLTWGMGPHALAAQRHMHEFGTTSRPLGMIAVAQRQYALLHPNADFRQPLGLEEYEQAPLLIAPLRKYDLASVFDGGAAYIVAPLSWARDHIACPVRLRGVAQAHSREHLAYCAEMVTNTTTPARQAGEQVYRAAGIEARDIDVRCCTTTPPMGFWCSLKITDFAPKARAVRLSKPGISGRTAALR